MCSHDTSPNPTQSKLSCTVNMRIHPSYKKNNNQHHYCKRSNTHIIISVHRHVKKHS